MKNRNWKMESILPRWIRERRIARRNAKIILQKRDFIAQQVMLAEDFYRFAHAAHKKGYPADLIMRVDGQTCQTAVNLASGTGRELFEYLCSWAAGEKLKAIERLDRFELTGVFEYPNGTFDVVPGMENFPSGEDEYPL